MKGVFLPEVNSGKRRDLIVCPWGGREGGEKMFDFLIEMYMLMVERTLPIGKGSKAARRWAEGIALVILAVIFVIGFLGQHLLTKGNEFGGTLCIGIAVFIAVAQVIVAFCLKKD